jgi:competence protein ComEA
MPPWRSFSSDAPRGTGQPPEADGDEGKGSSRLRWLAPALAALGGLAAGVVVAAGVALSVLTPASSTPWDDVGAPLDVADPALAAITADVGGELVIDVAGAVAQPGLHHLPPGSRVGDAIAAAGGFAPRADLTAAGEGLNLALPLEDGAKVLVPELGIDRPGPAAAAAADGRIDLNVADGPALESLPGIGPVTAGKIMAARSEAPFASVDDLRARGLVGEKVFEDIADLVRVG